MRIIFSCLIALAITLAMAGASHAFNGRRSGFMLGVGLGPGFSSYTQTVSPPRSGETTGERENELALATEFKIGAGIGERFMLYYVNCVSWFRDQNVLGQDVVVANGVGLVGVSYFLENASPSLYLLGLVGLSSWDAPFEDAFIIYDSEGTALTLSDLHPHAGFGIGAGVGWEFSPHWSLEGMLTWGNPSITDDTGQEAEYDALSLMLTFNYTAY